MPIRFQISSRRRFIKQGAASLLLLSSQTLGRCGYAAPNDKLNIAAIGAGGRGGHNLSQLDKEAIVALCDVDENRAAKSLNKYEGVPFYKDFRVMLDKQNDIDAVAVSTPDHTHAVAALDVIQRGKHIYLEKPMAHNVLEARAIMKAAREAGVQTQLGNQGHSSGEIRKVREWIAEGAIGSVSEVNVWYDNGGSNYGGVDGRPGDAPEIPDTLDWDLWLGPAAKRPYHPAYLPGSWRSWFDFGTGVLGDWTCHILDPAFWAMDLDSPTRITAYDKGNFSKERFPLETRVEYEFPARGARGPVKVVWRYGKNARLPEQFGDIGLKDWNAKAGAVIVGDKGAIVHGSHGAGGARIIPESRAKNVKTPEQTIPRVIGGHHQDWIRACKDGKPASGRFEYGGPLSETALLGVIATMLDRQTLEWDAKSARFTGNDKANELLQYDYRPGWSLA